MHTTDHLTAPAGLRRVCSAQRRLISACILVLTLSLLAPLVSMGATTTETALTGDRIVVAPKTLGEWIPAMLSADSYKVEAGDTLSIGVQGKANLNYTVQRNTSTSESGQITTPSDEVVVAQDGTILLPLAGKLAVAGKTVPEIEELIRKGLSKYIKQFEVSVSIAKVRSVNVWITGEAENPGPMTMVAVSSVSLASLQAGIKPTGSTRRITLTRGGTKKTVDLYRMISTGDASDDIQLEPGDTVHIPPVTRYAEVTGEVTRPGKYEMVAFSATADKFRIRDLIELSSGTLPSAAQGRCFVERIGDDGRKSAVNVDLRSDADANGTGMPLQPGDVVVVPSISAFQPMIRLIGEFKGDGVYTRTPGSTREDVQNKSGIYFLKTGQTVLDVISATGGVTPQADLGRARIERAENGSTKSIPIDLDRLLVANDKAADLALQTGDTLVLPARVDKIHIFGQIKSPGSYTYSPNRRLVDYLGDADGPTALAKLTSINIVRGTAEAPNLTKINVSKAIQHGSTDGNPVLEPGDIVFIPTKFISDWRDGVQLVFTSLSLTSLLRRL